MKEKLGAELSNEELLRWLEDNLNRSAKLQISHPHLARYPTKEDKQAYQQIKDRILNKPKVNNNEIIEFAENIWDTVVVHNGAMPAICQAVEDFLKEKGFEVEE